MNPLARLHDCGQSFWLDQMRRSLVTSGRLAQMVADDGLGGMTSNPTIFQKAMTADPEYQDDIHRMVEAGLGPMDVMLELMITDIQMAADVLRPVHDRTGGQDGFISLEVPPGLASDTAGTVSAARDFWKRVDRPNLMIKVPATREGLPAIEQLLYEGLNVNITLMFNQRHYESVATAYITALERRVNEGLPVDRVASVASFFVSRVDTAVDRELDRRGESAAAADAEPLRALRGTAAVANARVTYERFTQLFEGAPSERIRSKGARVQRPLWASTGTKDPAYSDIKYVTELIGPHTVNTMPDATADAFRDHGTPVSVLGPDASSARELVAALGRSGIDLEAVGEQLQADGVKLFTESFDALLAAIAERHQAVSAGAR
ncbi:MAG: transaldolase [Candidatus Dormibacteria bacterium]